MEHPALVLSAEAEAEACVAALEKAGAKAVQMNVSASVTVACDEKRGIPCFYSYEGAGQVPSVVHDPAAMRVRLSGRCCPGCQARDPLVAVLLPKKYDSERQTCEPQFHELCGQCVSCLATFKYDLSAKDEYDLCAKAPKPGLVVFSREADATLENVRRLLVNTDKKNREMLFDYHEAFSVHGSNEDGQTFFIEAKSAEEGVSKFTDMQAAC